MPALRLTIAFAFVSTLLAAGARAAENAPAHPAASPAVASAQPPKAAAEGVAVMPVPADSSKGKKSCEDVKASIDAKLKAKGVKTFTLDIVGKDETKDAKVVGSCEGGKKKITYKRG